MLFLMESRFIEAYTETKTMWFCLRNDAKMSLRSSSVCCTRADVLSNRRAKPRPDELSPSGPAVGFEERAAAARIQVVSFHSCTSLLITGLIRATWGEEAALCRPSFRLSFRLKPP